MDPVAKSGTIKMCRPAECRNHLFVVFRAGIWITQRCGVDRARGIQVALPGHGFRANCRRHVAKAATVDESSKSAAILANEILDGHFWLRSAWIQRPDIMQEISPTRQYESELPCPARTSCSRLARKSV